MAVVNVCATCGSRAYWRSRQEAERQASCYCCRSGDLQVQALSPAGTGPVRQEPLAEAAPSEWSACPLCGSALDAEEEPAEEAGLTDAERAIADRLLRSVFGDGL